MTPSPASGVVAFGDFELHVAERRLLAGGRPLTLGARAYDVLRTLVECRHRVVSREELLDAVWPGLVVEENNISVQIGTLRRLLGSDAIATIPGRGYQFAMAIDAPGGAGAAVPPGPSTSPPMLWNLLTAVAPLLGREQDLLHVLQALDGTRGPTGAGSASGARLLTLTGAGGVGKTRLAQEALILRGGGHAHGGCFVDLAPLPAGASVAGTVAAALGLDLGPGDPEHVLPVAMVPLDVLLVLDNAEHVLEAVARLCAELLAKAPSVCTVVTSQTPLKVVGEQVFRLEPLEVPAAGSSPAEAEAFGAVRLFAERARAADRRFAITPDNVGAVIEVCRCIDGLPLALELAAARVPVLGVRGLADALEHRFEVLTAGARLAPARQQTLRAALEWSLSLLDPTEQRVFRCLGVVAATASLDMVQQLAGAGGPDRWRVVEALGGLVDRSLVQVTRHDPPRYRMLDTPRSLARLLLVQAGEWDAVAQRHALAVRSVFEQACRRIVNDGCHQAGEMVLMELSRDDARTAFDWALGHDRLTAVSLMIGVGLLRSAQGAFTLDAPPELVTEALAMKELGQLPATMTAWWAFNYADYERSDSRMPPLGKAWVERALELADRQGETPAMQVAQAALLAYLPVDSAQSAELAAAVACTAQATLPFVRTTALAAVTLRHWRRAENREAVVALETMLATMQQQGVVAVARVARTSLIAFWLGADQLHKALQVGHALLAELHGTRNERALADCRRLVVTALLFDNQNAQARDLVTVGWAGAGARDERMHPGWLDLLALLAAQEGRQRTAALLLGRADQAWAARHRGRTSVRVRERVLAAMPSGGLAGPFDGASMAGVTDAAIEALALATCDA